MACRCRIYLKAPSVATSRKGEDLVCAYPTHPTSHICVAPQYPTPSNPTSHICVAPPHILPPVTPPLTYVSHPQHPTPSNPTYSPWRTSPAFVGDAANVNVRGAVGSSSQHVVSTSACMCSMPPRLPLKCASSNMRDSSPSAGRPRIVCTKHAMSVAAYYPCRTRVQLSVSVHGTH